MSSTVLTDERLDIRRIIPTLMGYLNSNLATANGRKFV